VPRRWPIGRRKRRTREHIIADLGVNHVERHALQCGFTVERFVHDYGIDLFHATFNRLGETEQGMVLLQLKATDHLKLLSGKQVIAFRIARADLLAWLAEPMPVILIVYDAKAEIAYWLYVQAHFESQPSINLAEVGEQVTVHLSRSNVVDRSAMKRFARFRDDVLRQMRGRIRHHA
jgi:hypothetical protein